MGERTSPWRCPLAMRFGVLRTGPLSVIRRTRKDRPFNQVSTKCALWASVWVAQRAPMRSSWDESSSPAKVSSNLGEAVFRMFINGVSPLLPFENNEIAFSKFVYLLYKWNATSEYYSFFPFTIYVPGQKLIGKLCETFGFKNLQTLVIIRDCQSNVLMSHKTNHQFTHVRSRHPICVFYTFVISKFIFVSSPSNYVNKCNNNLEETRLITTGGLLYFFSGNGG